MIKKICIINGPNLNLLGHRETNIYGNLNLEEINLNLKKKFSEIEFLFYQSNSEYELIDAIQDAGKNCDALIINAGAYSHTSIAMADAISAINISTISVHISNIYKREEYRHIDLISEKCEGAIIGLGTIGYELAIECIIEKNKK
jgi:3-dehydroquinate dehydratase-2